MLRIPKEVETGVDLKTNATEPRRNTGKNILITTLLRSDSVLIVTFPFLLSFLGMGDVPIDYTIKITGEGREDCFSRSIVFLKPSSWFQTPKREYRICS